MDVLPAKTFPFQGRLFKRLDHASRKLLLPDKAWAGFAHPAGEPALRQPDSVSWRIFKNPVTVFIGGVTAVILELAEPRVRSGVWEHSGFRSDPVRRLRRTGLAAMVTVYGARSSAETMIAGVRRMHARVRGETPCGQPYFANDPGLLNWVQATAAFGFMQAYHTYAAPLPRADRDRYYREGEAAARLFGATGPPLSEADVQAYFRAMQPRLEPSPVIFEFLDIMRTTRILPLVFHPVQSLLVRAAVSLTPAWVCHILGLGSGHRLRSWEAALVRQGSALADRIVLESSPAVQSCLRLGLPADYLYRYARSSN